MSILKDLAAAAIPLIPSLIFPKKTEALASALWKQRARLDAKRAKIEQRLRELEVKETK